MNISQQSDRIRERRKAQGLSQKALAQRIGTNQGQVSKFESGESVPSSAVLAQIAQALDISTDWLLGLTDETDPGLCGEDLDTKERAVVSALRQGERLQAIKKIVLDE